MEMRLNTHYLALIATLLFPVGVTGLYFLLWGKRWHGVRQMGYTYVYSFVVSALVFGWLVCFGIVKIPMYVAIEPTMQASDKHMEVPIIVRKNPGGWDI